MNITSTNTQPEKSASNSKTLYRIGAFAILIAVIFFRRNYGAELMVSNGFGIFEVPKTDPVSALEWFTLLQGNPYVGLSLLGLYDLINYALVGLLFLSLYAALKNTSRNAVGLATIFSLVGITVYFASNQALGMLTLSQKYAAATSDAQQTTLLAAGEALLAVHQGTGSYLSIFLVLLAGLILSIVMLRSGIFSKATAVMGLLTNGIYLAYFPALILAPALVWLPPTLSAPFRIIWYVMCAIQLLRLARA